MKNDFNQRNFFEKENHIFSIFLAQKNYQATLSETLFVLNSEGLRDKTTKSLSSFSRIEFISFKVFGAK